MGGCDVNCRYGWVGALAVKPGGGTMRQHRLTSLFQRDRLAVWYELLKMLYLGLVYDSCMGTL